MTQQTGIEYSAPLASPRDQALDGLREFVLAIEHTRQIFARSLNLNISDVSALSYLLLRGGLGQTDLASYLDISTSSVTTLIDRLEARGFASRGAHPHDRRRTVVSLTDVGKKVMDEIRDWYAEALDTIPQADLVSVGASLKIISHELTTHPAPTD